MCGVAAIGTGGHLVYPVPLNVTTLANKVKSPKIFYSAGYLFYCTDPASVCCLMETCKDSHSVLEYVMSPNL